MRRIEGIRARLAAATPQDWNALIKNGVWRGTVIDLLMEAPQDLRDLLELYDEVQTIFMQDAMLNPTTGMWSVHVDDLKSLLAILSRLDSPVGADGL